MFWVFWCLLPCVLRTPCSVGGKWHACLARLAVCNSQQAKCGTHQAKSGTEKPLRIGVRHQNHAKPSLYRDYDFLDFFVRICLATQSTVRATAVLCVKLILRPSPFIPRLVLRNSRFTQEASVSSKVGISTTHSRWTLQILLWQKRLIKAKSHPISINF